MAEAVIWKDIKGYEGLYKVNNAGDVLSIARKGNWRGNHLLVPSNDGHGYRQVNICKNGKLKSVKVHRLVAEAFIPNPYNLPQVNHIDTNDQIVGPQQVYPYENYIYKVENTTGEFSIDTNKAKIINQDNGQCEIEIVTGKKGEFNLTYTTDNEIKYTLPIIILSL